jgi:hypothetical protein
VAELRPVVVGVSLPVAGVDLRFPRRGDLGRLLVIELLVALMKDEFATLSIGVGSARRMR